jgi:aspartate racemase
MSRKTVGLIGGVGPGATAAFYQNVVRRYGARHGGDQPALLIYSVPMEATIEAAILNGATAGPEVDRLIARLEDGVRRLAQAEVAGIVMPCNTLQAYLPQIVARAGLPYIHLIRETVRHIQQQGYRRVALICTQPMRSLGLYQSELDAQAVPHLLPTESEQAGITQTILDTLHARPDPSAPLRPIVRRLETVADSILLGCSDLTAFAEPGFTRLPVVDAMEVLAAATVEFLLSGEA